MVLFLISFDVDVDVGIVTLSIYNACTVCFVSPCWTFPINAKKKKQQQQPTSSDSIPAKQHFCKKSKNSMKVCHHPAQQILNLFPIAVCVSLCSQYESLVQKRT